MFLTVFLYKVVISLVIHLFRILPETPYVSMIISLLLLKTCRQIKHWIRPTYPTLYCTLYAKPKDIFDNLLSFNLFLLLSFIKCLLFVLRLELGRHLSYTPLRLNSIIFSTSRSKLIDNLLPFTDTNKSRIDLLTETSIKLKAKSKDFLLTC